MTRPLVIVVRGKTQAGHSIADIFKDKYIQGEKWEVIQWNMDAHTLSTITENDTLLNPDMVRECINRLSENHRGRPLVVLMEQTTLKNVTSQSQQVIEEEKFLKQLEHMLAAVNDLHYLGSFGKLPLTSSHKAPSQTIKTVGSVFALMIKGQAMEILASCDKKHRKTWSTFNAYLTDSRIQYVTEANVLSYCSMSRAPTGVQENIKNNRNNRSRRRSPRKHDDDYEYHWRTCDNGDSPNKWTWGKLGWYLLLFLLLGLFLGLIWLALYFRVEYCLDKSIDCGW